MELTVVVAQDLGDEARRIAAGRCRKPLTSESEGVAVMAWTFLDHSHKAEKFKKDAKLRKSLKIGSQAPAKKTGVQCRSTTVICENEYSSRQPLPYLTRQPLPYPIKIPRATNDSHFNRQ
jgi:hypothetical protein